MGVAGPTKWRYGDEHLLILMSGCLSASRIVYGPNRAAALKNFTHAVVVGVETHIYSESICAEGGESGVASMIFPMPDARWTRTRRELLKSRLPAFSLMPDHAQNRDDMRRDFLRG